MRNLGRWRTTKVIVQWLRILGEGPWLEIAEKLGRIGQKILKHFGVQGLYEVLEYESTLVLHDRDGKRATLIKREKVRYLQDHIIAFRDQAWGDGEILMNYRCSPGVPVDEYRSGHKTHVLISLREERQRGDIDVFNITWGIRNGFLVEDCHWSTAVSHKTKELKVNVLFPEDRPPIISSVVESNHKGKGPVGRFSLSQQPDGRWLMAWEKRTPRLFENYILRWRW